MEQAEATNDKEQQEEGQLEQEILDKRKNEILGIIIIALGILSAISLFTDTVGIVGRKLSESYHTITGLGSYLIPLFLFIWGITLIRLKGLRFNSRLLGFILSYLSILSIYHLYSYPVFTLDYGLMGYGGGFLGGFLSWGLLKLFGYIGTYVLLSTILLIGLLLWSDLLLLSVLQKIKDFILLIFRQKEKPLLEEDYFEEQEGEIIENIFTDYPTEEVAATESMNELSSDKKTTNKNVLKKEKQLTKPENFTTENYRLPGTKLLKDSKHLKKKPGNKSMLLEETLASFSVKARVIKVSHGPTITRYELQPASGVKVSRIVSLADDIALALAAPGVRIEAPIPGKAAVGIEVPHQKNSMVRAKDILAANEFSRAKSKLALALGMGIDGKPIIADLTQMPHLLVAGATGSGKSVCINTIITSILFKATPEEVKLLLIDPKKVELSTYQGLPHLFAPVVTDPKKAASVLKLVINEMENRYEVFSSSGARGITSYNKKAAPEEHMPYIVVIIDELSDLMMVAANEVEDNICRLAQMARAAGIHLVIATQRPSVDVITGLIKANIPSRISFAVYSQTDSRTVLDMGGAEKLLGRGDMLFAPVGSQKPQRIQGAFIDNDEINRTVDFVKNQADPEYEVQLEEIDEIKLALDQDTDELYQEAVKLVVNYRASISMLQRRLHIGHSRAARLIDLMEEDGIVGPYAGSKAREVLIDKDELEDFLNGNNKGKCEESDS